MRQKFIHYWNLARFWAIVGAFALYGIFYLVLKACQAN